MKKKIKNQREYVMAYIKRINRIRDLLLEMVAEQAPELVKPLEDVLIFSHYNVKSLEACMMGREMTPEEIRAVGDTATRLNEWWEANRGEFYALFIGDPHLGRLAKSRQQK